MADEDVDIIKMDATANDVPASFNVRGFPTLYWKPKSGEPITYEVRYFHCCLISFRTAMKCYLRLLVISSVGSNKVTLYNIVLTPTWGVTVTSVAIKNVSIAYDDEGIF